MKATIKDVMNIIPIESNHLQRLTSVFETEIFIQIVGEKKCYRLYGEEADEIAEMILNTPLKKIVY